MSEHDWTEVVGAFGVFALLISVFTVTVVQLAKTRRARYEANRADDYRKLAETAAQAQAENARLLAAMDGRLGGMETRMTTLERVLREVD
jgi:F0F1-type ATP synthase membrane subunit b/b'